MAGAYQNYSLEENRAHFSDRNIRYNYQGSSRDLPWQGLPGRGTHYSSLIGEATTGNYAHMWNLIATADVNVERAIEFFGAMLWTDPELALSIDEMEAYRDPDKTYTIPEGSIETEHSKEMYMGMFLTMMRCGHEKDTRVGTMLAAQSTKDKESWCSGAVFPTEDTVYMSLKPYFQAEKDITKIVLTAFLLHKSSLSPNLGFLNTCQIVGICKRRLFQMGFISMLLKTTDLLTMRVHEFLGKMVCNATNNSLTRLRHFFENEFVDDREDLLYAKSFDRKYFTSLALKRNLFLGGVCQATLIQFNVGAKGESFVLPPGDISNIAIQMSLRLTAKNVRASWEGCEDLEEVYDLVKEQDADVKKMERDGYIITKAELATKRLDVFLKKEEEARKARLAPAEVARVPIVVEAGARAANVNPQPQPNANPQQNQNLPPNPVPQASQSNQAPACDFNPEN